jgi:DNA repair exonuclease SbcCD nuclease subunit
VRLLHVADVHLDAAYAAFGALADARRSAVIEAFRGLPALAARHAVDAVLVAGDLFDRPTPRVVARAAAAEAFAALVRDGRPVFVVPGNHDSNHFQPHPYRDELGGAELLLEPAFGPPRSAATAAGPLHVYGLSHDPGLPGDPLQGFRRSPAAGVHVVLLHGPVHGAPQWGASPNALRLLPEELARFDVDYVALGDFHRPRRLDPAPAWYPGSFAAVDLTETGPRGFLLVDVEPGQAPRTEHVPSGVAPVVDLGRLDVGSCATLLDVVAAVSARTPAAAIPLVVLEGTPRFALDGAEVAEALIGRYGHARVIDETRFVSAARLDEIAAHDTVAAHLVRLARERSAGAGDAAARRIADRALRIALRELGVE